MGALLAAGVLACTRPNPAFFVEPLGDGALPGVDGPGGDAAGGKGGAPFDGGSGGMPVDPALDAASPEAGDTNPALDMGAETAPAPDLVPDRPPEVASPDADLRPTTGLVAHWAFDRQPAAGVTSISDGRGNTALLRGSVTWSGMVPPTSSGPQSLSFDGASGFVDLMIPMVDMRPTSEGDKTMAVWFRSTRGTPTERTLMAMFFRDEPIDVGMQLGFNGTQLAAWRWGRPPNDVLAPAFLNRWHHGAYTYDDNGGWHVLYLDGVEQSRVNGRNPEMGKLDRFKLGTYDDGLEPMKYQGQMQDVRIYNRALSASEIRTLAGLPPQ
jgi:hypothetical protein